MLVRDQDRVQILGFLADFSEPAREFAHAEARVDQDPGLRSGEKRRIPCTAAREYAESDQETFLLRLVLAGTGAGHNRYVRRDLSAALRGHLLFDHVNQFLHSTRALVKGGSLVVCQLDLIDLFDTLRAQFAGDADVQAVDAIFSFEIGGTG